MGRGSWAHPWTKGDPTTLSSASSAIHQIFERLLCQKSDHANNCACGKLARLYGTRLFRCNYSLCQSRRISFATAANRESHCKSHTRPFTCSHPSCEFNTLGFISHSELRRHEEMCHVTAPPKQISFMEDPNQDEIVPLLFDLISLGMVREIERLSPRISRLDSHIRYSLLAEASGCGSLLMAQNVNRACELTVDEYCRIVARNSIKNENSAVFEWIAPVVVKHGKETLLMEISITATNASSPDVFETWRTHFSGTLGSYCPNGYKPNYFTGSGPHDVVTNVPWRQHYSIMEEVIKAVEDSMKQERLADLWREQAAKGYFDSSQLGRALLAVSRTTCSILLAKTLIEEGANVNYQDIPPLELTNQVAAPRLAKSPLHEATLKTSQQAANFTKFLLLEGASPDLDCNIKNLRNEKKTTLSTVRTPGMQNGAKRISKWLDMDWEELVRWAAEQRSQRSCI